MRLLIADSDPTLADIYESFFSGEGYDVVTVGDGLRCLNAVRKHVPDVLILEYELPWGGGDGVLAGLRQEFPFMPIDVVLITGDYSVEDVTDALVAPVVGCLRKPFRLGDLSDMLRAVTEPLPPQSAGGFLKEMTVHSRRAVQH